MRSKNKKLVRLVAVKEALRSGDAVSRPKPKPKKRARRKSEQREAAERFERLASIERWGRKPDDAERINWPLRLAVAQLAERRGLMTESELAKNRAGFEAAAVALFDGLQRPEDLGELYNGIMAVAHRRKLGAHYTPTHLAKSVVKQTLYPLLATLGRDRTADQVLALKICDPAIGGAVFLLHVVRQLASEVRRAWRRHGLLDYGETEAKRLVAQRCAYGVDKDPMAVTVSQVALWLEVGDPRHTPEEIAPNVKHGDALVGLDNIRQFEAFHWDPSKLAYVEPLWVELGPALQATLARTVAVGFAREDCDALAEICRRHKSTGLGVNPEFWDAFLRVPFERQHVNWRAV